MNDVASAPPHPAGEKCVQGDIGYSNDTIGHAEADPTHRPAKERLLKGAWCRDILIGIVYVNDAASYRNSRRGQKIDSTDQIMMAMQRVIISVPQFATQRLEELFLLPDRDRRRQNTTTERDGFFVQCARVRQRAIEAPIDIDAAGTRVAQHAHKPVLHGTAVEALDNMQNARRRHCANKTAALLSSVTESDALFQNHRPIFWVVRSLHVLVQVTNTKATSRKYILQFRKRIISNRSQR